MLDSLYGTPDQPQFGDGKLIYRSFKHTILFYEHILSNKVMW